MKHTLTAIGLAIGLAASAQPYADISTGLTSNLRMSGIVNIGVSTRYGEAFATAQWPKMAGVGFGYALRGFTPYVGYGTAGAFGGLRIRHYNAIACDVRISGKALSLTIGYTLKRKP
jgi:opacity protein-like surface antigen